MAPSAGSSASVNKLAEHKDEYFKESSCRLADHVYELLPESTPDVEIVFFHGLQMEGSDPAHSFWRTWKMRNTEECWPTTLLPECLQHPEDSSPSIKARVLSVSYEGRPDQGKLGTGSGATDVYPITENLIHDLILGSADVAIGQKERVPVFLVGHDLGGILIKEFVMKVEHKEAVERDEMNKAKLTKFLENLKSVFFFATPLCGSKPIEEMAAKIDGKDRNQMLRLMEVLNKDVARINGSFRNFRLGNSKRCKFTSYAVHPAHETTEGGFKNVVVVQEASARNDVDYFFSASGNHFSVCQLENKTSTALMMLLQAIRKEVADCKSNV